MNVFINTYGVLGGRGIWHAALPSVDRAVASVATGPRRCYVHRISPRLRRSVVIVSKVVLPFFRRARAVLLGGFEVVADHFGDEFVKADCGSPAEFGFGGLAEQGSDFGVPH